MSRIPLVGQSYPARSLAVSAQECVNVFPALIEDPNEKSKNIAVLYGCPGKHLGATLATDVRGLWSGAGRLFVASGLNLIELNQAWGVVTTHGYAPTNDGLPVQIFSNGNQLMLVSGGKAYCDNGAGPVLITTTAFAGNVRTFGFGVSWNSGDKFLTDGSWIGTNITINAVVYTIATITDDETMTLTAAAGVQPSAAYSHLGEALTAVTGAVMNGTFFVQRPATVGHPEYGAQINFSAVLDGTSWSGLDFFRKEGAPDNIRGIVADNHQLYAMGDETGEVFQADPNAGVDGAPFISVPGTMFNYGSFSAWGATAFDGRVFFLGGDEQGGAVAYVLDGFTPRRISTAAEEAAWHAAGLGRNAIAYSEQHEGHAFWCINFGVQMWAFDPGTGAWHQRYKYTAGAFAPFLTNLHTFIPEWGTAGVHVTACSTGPAKVYETNLNFYDDEGTDIKWRRALPYIYNGGKRFYMGRLDLEMETGAVASGAAPIVTYDYSDDRGANYINPRDSNEGVHSDTAHRVFWNRNGSSYGRVMRLAGIGQSKVALIDLQCDITLGVV